MKNIVIFGAGGFAREAAIMIGAINERMPYSYWLWGYVVDNEYFQENTFVNDLPVIGNMDWLIANKESVVCVIAVGDSNARKQIFHRLKNENIAIETIISPDVYIDHTCSIGEGCYIGHRCVISTNVNIGAGTFLNTDVMLGHDVSIGDFVSISPRGTISGNCSIGNGVSIGGNAYIIPNRKIGDDVVIAAGSVVFSNIKNGNHVLGNPAKKVRF